MSSPDRVLTVEGLSTGYGSMRVVHDLSLVVRPGELVTVVGRNGAGKTTTMLALAGLRYGRSEGTVRLGDVDLSKAAPADIVRHGLSLVPEGHRIFRSLSVRDNLMVGATATRRRDASRIPALLEQMYELFPILRTYENRNAGYLSGGEQQMVAIAQALMAEPSVLLLDEPTSGLAPAVITQIYRSLFTLRAQNLALLVVEQSVERAFSHCDRFYVLERGTVRHSGTPADAGAAAEVAAIVRGFADESA
jgi:branched-chain amino acid transport system ATP-binding protein